MHRARWRSLSLTRRRWADIGEISEGDAASVEMTLSPEVSDQLYCISQDDNPVHTDENAAQQFGFPRRVAYGVLAVCAITRLIGTQLPGPGSLCVAQDFEYIKPILVGDRIRATVTVERVSLAARVVVLRTEVLNLDSGLIALRGSMKAMVPPRV